MIDNDITLIKEQKTYKRRQKWNPGNSRKKKFILFSISSRLYVTESRYQILYTIYNYWFQFLIDMQWFEWQLTYCNFLFTEWIMGNHAHTEF